MRIFRDGHVACADALRSAGDDRVDASLLTIGDGVMLVRKRALSDEERVLWESVAKQTKPLRKRSRAAKPQLAAPDSASPVAVSEIKPWDAHTGEGDHAVRRMETT